MKLTKTDILAIPHHKALGFDGLKNFKVTGVSINSRTLKTGDLFVAIRGDQFDGHNFISKAIEAGAAAIIVDRRWAETNATMVVSINIPRIIVDNTIESLGQLAKHYRRKFDIPFIAVCGSNGKTTTKEMIKNVLNSKYNVLCTEGNLNNHIGVPQTLFRLEKKYNVAVIELGTNHPGEIEYLCSILEPTHGLITNIGREHLEFFGSIEGVAKAEGELFDWLAKHRGIAFVNADDKNVVRISKKLKKIISYGFSARSVSIKGTIESYNSNAQPILKIKPRGKRAFNVTVDVPGLHNANNALATAAVGITMKIVAGDIQKALASFRPASKRMQVERLGKITILNDTYNSNPDSVLAALSTLNMMNSSGKKIAVLGDMLELGGQGADIHRQIGKSIHSRILDVLLTYGPLSKFTNESASIETKAHFESKAMLIDYLFQMITENDILLVKGSRGMKMEEIATALNERLSQKVQN